MLKFKAISPEVLIADGDIATIDQDDIEQLKDLVRQAPRQRVRLCAHRDTEDALHEMVIALLATVYFPPHRHLNKSESFHLVDGEMDVILFKDDGSIDRLIPMGVMGSGKTYYYRLSSPRYHILLPRSDFVVFHETTNGPFRREETDYAAWAPGEDAPPEEISGYLEKLRQEAELLTAP